MRVPRFEEHDFCWKFRLDVNAHESFQRRVICTPVVFSCLLTLTWRVVVAVIYVTFFSANISFSLAVRV